jgi:hypothetical protein
VDARSATLDRVATTHTLEGRWRVEEEARQLKRAQNIAAANESRARREERLRGFAEAAAAARAAATERAAQAHLEAAQRLAEERQLMRKAAEEMEAAARESTAIAWGNAVLATSSVIGAQSEPPAVATLRLDGLAKEEDSFASRAARRRQLSSRWRQMRRAGEVPTSEEAGGGAKEIFEAAVKSSTWMASVLGSRPDPLTAAFQSATPRLS